MSTTQIMQPCRACDRPTLHLTKQTNHVLHLLLSVFTLGLWLVVWLLVGLYAKPASCIQCGMTHNPNRLGRDQLGAFIAIGALVGLYLMYLSGS